MVSNMFCVGVAASVGARYKKDLKLLWANYIYQIKINGAYKFLLRFQVIFKFYLVTNILSLIYPIRIILHRTRSTAGDPTPERSTPGEVRSVWKRCPLRAVYTWQQVRIVVVKSAWSIDRSGLRRCRFSVHAILHQICHLPFSSQMIRAKCTKTTEMKSC